MADDLGSTRNSTLIQAIIGRVLNRYRWVDYHTFEDLNQEAQIAAWLAINEYDGSIPFEGYLWFEVLSAVSSYYRKNRSTVKIPRDKLREYHQALRRGIHQDEEIKAIHEAYKTPCEFFDYEAPVSHDYEYWYVIQKFTDTLIAFIASLNPRRASIWIESAGFFDSPSLSGKELAEKYQLRDAEHAELITRDCRKLFKRRLLSGRTVDVHGLKVVNKYREQVME